MKFTTNKEQRDFFYKNSFVEFADVLTPDQVQSLHGEANKIVAARLKISPRGLAARPPIDQYMQGRDLWRESDPIRKVVCARGLAQLASELLDAKQLRLAYDQFYPAGGELKGNLSLREFSSMQGVIGGAILALTNSEKDPHVLSVFPAHAGSISFFKPDLVVDFQELSQRHTGEFLMFVYTAATTVYVLQEKDPHTHSLKRLGYGFGDKLAEGWHPTVYP